MDKCLSSKELEFRESVKVGDVCGLQCCELVSTNESKQFVV